MNSVMCAEPSSTVRSIMLGGVPTLQVGRSAGRGPGGVVVLLHGFDMAPGDLALATPYARDVTFLLPEGGFVVPSLVRQQGGLAWWKVNVRAREASLRFGPRDLSGMNPEGIARGRERVSEVMRAATLRFGDRPISLAGFSQGAMLALDWLLEGGSGLAGLILLSGARIRADRWAKRMSRVRDLAAFQSHGCLDRDISFDAALALRDSMVQHGAHLTWLPFNGGHEVPTAVWRGVGRFVRSLTRRTK